MPVSRPKLPFFAAPVTPALYNNNDHNNKIFYFPYWGLQGCTSQQVARANLGRPVNLPAGIFDFTWLKWGKIILGEKKKIQWIKDLQRLKFSEKTVSVHSLAPLLFSTLAWFAQRTYRDSSSVIVVNDNIYFLRIKLRKKQLTSHSEPSRESSETWFINLVELGKPPLWKHWTETYALSAKPSSLFTTEYWLLNKLSW